MIIKSDMKSMKYFYKFSLISNLHPETIQPQNN